MRAQHPQTRQSAACQLPADTDDDGDVDLADYLFVAECFRGPGVPVDGGRPRGGGPNSSLADLDGDADLSDLLAFQAAFTGAR